MRIPYVTYTSDASTRPTAHEDATWEEVAQLVCDHAPAECDPRTCRGRECPYKKVAAWSPVLIDGSRLNANVRAVTALVLDVDHWDPDEDPDWIGPLSRSGLKYALATSHQHSEAAPRLRVVIPFSRPALPDEYPRLRRQAVIDLGIPADPRVHDLSRIFYLPTSRVGIEPVSLIAEGAPLDVDEMLARAPQHEPETPAPEGGVSDWATTAGSPPAAGQLERLREALAALPKRGNGAGATYQAFSLIFHEWGLGIEDGWPYLTEWNEGCGEPHSPSSLERQLWRCASRPRDTPRGWRRGGDLVAAVLARAQAPVEGSWEEELARADRDVKELMGGGVGRRARRPMFRAIQELLAQPRPEESWLVQGLIKRRGVHMLGGRSKIGKSWFLSALGAAVSAGEAVYGRFPVLADARVAYFFAEELEVDVQGHCAAILAGLGPEAAARARLHVEPRGMHFDLLDDGCVAELIASVRWLGGVELLCLEPLRNIHSAAENESDLMAVVMARATKIADILECAVALVHHETKPGGGGAGRKGGERLRGSGAIFGAVDGMFSISPVEKTPTRIEVLAEVEIRGARSPEDFGLVLEIEDDAQGRAVRATVRVAEVRQEAPAEERAPDRDALEAVMAEVERHAMSQEPALRHRGCSCPPGAVVHAIDLIQRGTHRVDAPRRRVRQAIRLLVDQGRLLRSGGEHGPLRVPPARLAALATEVA
jgi:hypothetical protein